MKNVNFTSIASLMSEIWRPDKSVRKWVLPRRPVGTMGTNDVQEMMCGHFQHKYDAIQDMIMKIGCMDELLSGLYTWCAGMLVLVIYAIGQSDYKRSGLDPFTCF